MQKCARNMFLETVRVLDEFVLFHSFPPLSWYVLYKGTKEVRGLHMFLNMFRHFLAKS